MHSASVPVGTARVKQTMALFSAGLRNIMETWRLKWRAAVRHFSGPNANTATVFYLMHVEIVQINKMCQLNQILIWLFASMFNFASFSNKIK